MVKLDGKKLSAAMKLKGVPDCSTLALRAGLSVATTERALKGGAVSAIDAYKIAKALEISESDIVVAVQGVSGWHKAPTTDHLGAWLTDNINTNAGIVLGLVPEEQRGTARLLLSEMVYYDAIRADLK